MYVTRPLSLYKNSPSALSLPPPEGPNSGILVYENESDQPTCCFGLVKGAVLMDLPFPQNTILTLRYSSGLGENRSDSYLHALFIPLLNLPLSSAQYYVIESRGKHKGKACTSSREEDIATCCFCFCCSYVNDESPRPFNPQDTYQRFKINTCGTHSFVANSIEADGIPPQFLESQGWEAYTTTLYDNFETSEALGLNSSLRSTLPHFDFSISSKSSSDPVVVGKWICPFIFIRDGTLEEQMSKTMYYEMTLEQNWEKIFERRNDVGGGNDVVVVDVSVRREVVLVGGNEVENREIVDGFMLYSNKQEGMGVGLSLAIVERVKWEQERVGFEWREEGEKNEMRVERVEEKGGLGSLEWGRFGSYVLVERFVLRRMDGSVVLTWEFKHTHQIRCKWE